MSDQRPTSGLFEPTLRTPHTRTRNESAHLPPSRSLGPLSWHDSDSNMTDAGRQPNQLPEQIPQEVAPPQNGEMPASLVQLNARLVQPVVRSDAPSTGKVLTQGDQESRGMSNISVDYIGRAYWMLNERLEPWEHVDLVRL